MKKVFLLLMLVSPLLSMAQVNDMYFVPKKEKKVIAVKSAEEIYMVDDVDSLEYVDEYVDEAGNAYFTNDLFDVMDDYTYSTRIVRFQSPRRLLSSNLYWDLRYDCGINDWFVYDDGYALYIYPTANNYLYGYPHYYGWMNRWNWNTFHGYHYNWHTPYYGYHDWWCYDDYYWHTPHWNHKVPAISWKPSHNSGNAPTNGMLSGNNGTIRPRNGQPTRTTADGGNPRREHSTRTTVNNGNPRREQSAHTTVNNGNPRREQSVRTTVNNGNPRRGESVRTTVNNGNPRRGESARAAAGTGGTTVRNTSGTSARQGQARTSVNSSNVKRVSTSGNSSAGRGESRSSSGYSRPSSTGVSRSSGSSSYSSGSSRGSSSSSYSSGSSRSSSSSSYSSGGGGSSSGGGRSGGSRR